MPVKPDGIMLPKSNSGQDVQQLSAKLRVHEAENGLPDGGIKILPIITETAAGVLAAATYAEASARLAGLTWGAEDLSAAIGARAARDENGRYTDVFRLARTMTILAAGAAEVAAIDTVFPNFRDMAAFEAECTEAERDGFTGKMAIHPAQVPVINAAFTPSAEAVQRSQAIVAAFAAAGNPGVVGIDGKMYDRPHLRLAERLLARAKAAGVLIPRQDDDPVLRQVGQRFRLQRVDGDAAQCPLISSARRGRAGSPMAISPRSRADSAIV